MGNKKRTGCSSQSWHVRKSHYWNSRRIIPRNNGADDWEIWTKSSALPENDEEDGPEEEACITAEVIINAAGLYAVPLSNSILPRRGILNHIMRKGHIIHILHHDPRLGHWSILHQFPDTVA
jgi:hypothetical protein